MPTHYLNNLMKKARGMLTGRKPMSATRKKMKRAKKYMAKGPAGEQRDYPVTEKSPVGKLQAKSRRTQAMLDELD